MPCLEVTVPKLEPAAKSQAAALLTKAFAAATGHSADIFGVRFFEYAPGEAAVGGKILEENAKSPYLHFLLYCPRLKRSVKQKLVSAFTEAFASATGKPDWQPVIHICEHPYDNVGVQGRLLSDAHEECAKRGFYYELPRD